ncbi:hypothetical protein CRE_05967 [Caenorhabditis remanei]|uniref:Uncharacterized protein n=1 Tax=Caenorhabditis remanei TaxID=31234 RepID=E3MZA8_CAERE|nr:hypothetical protein CRE_05967 [Caenorhabditis remanei]
MFASTACLVFALFYFHPAVATDTDFNNATIAVNSTETSTDNSTDLLRQENGFPHRFFIAASENATTHFKLSNKGGIIYTITIDLLYREIAWVGDHEIYLVLNISEPGAAAFLTRCNDHPISLKPNVVLQEYKLSRRCLDVDNGCLKLHVIATEGAVDGQISVTARANNRWSHLHIILAIIFFFTLFMVLFRQFSNHILRIVTSYTVMEELPQCHQ